MDVEIQVLKHLARDDTPTVPSIDQYCRLYKNLFPEVRSYEYFKYLHLGIISPIKKKTLPEIAKVVGINSPQSLHHFISKSPWSTQELQTKRLSILLEALKGRGRLRLVPQAGRLQL